MRNAVIASTALMASSALAQGTAHVVNACKYEVHLCNTPAEFGGFSQIDKVLQPGDSYSQQWTQLTNDQGWSIKLAKTPSYQTDLMQYEYTFHNDGTIWYDLSEVDGNPWDGNWMITASKGCNPKQQAYRYSTDDAYGMQACPDTASITVTLCSGESQEDGAASSASAELSSKVASSEVAPAPSSYAASSPASPSEAAPETTTTGGWTGDWNHGYRTNGNGFVEKAAAVTPSPTTLVTSSVSVSDAGDYDVTVTDIVTEVATAYVTAPAKRHEHHPRHPHQRHEA